MNHAGFWLVTYRAWRFEWPNYLQGLCVYTIRCNEHNWIHKAVVIEVLLVLPFFDQSISHGNVGCRDINIINKHLLGLENMLAVASVGCSDIGWAEVKCMVEIANVQGPRKYVGWIEMSVVPRSDVASSTVTNMTTQELITLVIMLSARLHALNCCIWQHNSVVFRPKHTGKALLR